jgi:hypothetical protein
MHYAYFTNVRNWFGEEVGRLIDPTQGTHWNFGACSLDANRGTFFSGW